MRFRLKSGATIGYVPRGRGDITLVMLHPIGLRAQVWGRLARELENEYRSLAVDLPGHGESDVSSAPQSIADMAASVREVVDTLAGSRAVLVGCSMGSAVAATVAAAAPPNVEALVLSNSSFGHSPERFTALTQRSAEAQRGMRAMLDNTIKRWFSVDALVNRADLVSEVRDWLLAGDPIVHSRGWLALRDFDYEPLLPALTLPSLVIGGEHDEAARPPAVAALAAALPNAEHRQIAGAGHLAPFDQPRLYADAVGDFLRRKLGSNG
jgi:pimeloyl-ACP methyl ester carboxylesterase